MFQWSLSKHCVQENLIFCQIAWAKNTCDIMWYDTEKCPNESMFDLDINSACFPMLAAFAAQLLDPIWSCMIQCLRGFQFEFCFFHKGRSFPSIQAIQATHLVASSNRWSRENTFCRRPRTSRLYSCRRKPRWPLPQTKSCVMWVKQWDFTMKSGDLMGSIMGFNRI